VSNENGFRIGVAKFRTMNLPDGSTAFWGSTTDARPTAKRWQSGGPPWRVKLDLEDTENAIVELELSMDSWAYSLDLPSQFRTGLRSVVGIQVCNQHDVVGTKQCLLGATSGKHAQGI
jgi:hypothetical protein